MHDVKELPNLLHGGEPRLYGDSTCRGYKRRRRRKDTAPEAKDFTNKRASRNRPLSGAGNETIRRESSARTRGEHAFLTLERIRGFVEVRSALVRAFQPRRLPLASKLVHGG